MARGSSEGCRTLAGCGAIRTTWPGGRVMAEHAAGARGASTRSGNATVLAARAYQHVPSYGSVHMRRFAACAFLALVVAATLAAQGEPAGPGMGQRRFAPPPDHWMTIDSLSQALGLSAEQRAKITPSYTALNGVMKDAAARRQAIRQQMQGGGGGGGGGGFTPGQEPTAAQRAAPDSSLLTVDRIFASPEFRGGSIASLAWLADGIGYTTLEPPVDGKPGRDIVRYDAETGIRTSLVPPARLKPAADSTPLDVESPAGLSRAAGTRIVRNPV